MADAVLYEYKILNDGTIELLKYVGKPECEIHIPHEIDGRAVTVVGDSCYTALKDVLEEVCIPFSIHTIKDWAFFGCHQLKTINFPITTNNLKCVGFCAFRETAYFNSEDNWDEGILYINHKRCIIASKDDYFQTYHKAAVKKWLYLPKKVTCIGESAFVNQKGFNFVIGQDVVFVNKEAFTNTDVEFPPLFNSRCSCHSSAFSYTPFFRNQDNWDNGCIYIGTALISCQSEDIKCAIKDGTTIIADGAFDYCKAKEVYVPASVEKIGISSYPEDLIFDCEALVS